MFSEAELIRLRTTCGEDHDQIYFRRRCTGCRRLLRHRSFGCPQQCRAAADPSGNGRCRRRLRAPRPLSRHSWRPPRQATLPAIGRRSPRSCAAARENSCRRGSRSRCRPGWARAWERSRPARRRRLRPPPVPTRAGSASCLPMSAPAPAPLPCAAACTCAAAFSSCVKSVPTILMVNGAPPPPKPLTSFA